MLKAGQPVPDALCVDYNVPGSNGRKHKVFWYDARERIDLPGNARIAGCCDCTGFYIEAVVRGKGDYICPHLHQLQAMAESVLADKRRREGTVHVEK